MLDRRHTAPPLWAQVMTDLLNNVVASAQVGDAIPSESELQAQYGASRVVIRRAVDELCHLGVLRKEQGRGTFVCLHAVEDRIGGISSWTKLVTESGHRASTGSRTVDVVNTPDHLRSFFGSDVDEVVRVERVRLLDDVPATVAVAFIPLNLLGDPAALEVHESVYGSMADAGIHLVRATEVIRAKVATDYEARFLNVPAGFPLIQVERMGYDLMQRPVSFDVTTSRGDLVRYRAELTGS